MEVNFVDRTTWLNARKVLLEQEKAFTKERDKLSEARRALPMVEVTEDYVFETADGKAVAKGHLPGHSSHLINAQIKPRRYPGLSVVDPKHHMRRYRENLYSRGPPSVPPSYMTSRSNEAASSAKTRTVSALWSLSGIFRSASFERVRLGRLRWWSE
jgi:hypothetical protein